MSLTAPHGVAATRSVGGAVTALPAAGPRPAERVGRCRECARAVSTSAMDGPVPTRCRQCRRAAQARYHVRSAIRVYREIGDTALADVLARLVELERR